MEFKNFLLESEKNMADVRATLLKIPAKHKALAKNYKFKFQKDNTLNGDDEHIGEIDDEKKVITIAAPWNYGREYTILHEIGHLIWKWMVNDKMKEKWGKIVKGTKDKMNQNAEELFCMAYANTYAESKIKIHDHPEWEKFVKSIP